MRRLLVAPIAAVAAFASCPTGVAALGCDEDDDCPQPLLCQDGLCAEREGEGEGEGEFVGGEGEGEGDVVGEGEGEFVVGEGEGEGEFVVGEGEGEGEGDVVSRDFALTLTPGCAPVPVEFQGATVPGSFESPGVLPPLRAFGDGEVIDGWTVRGSVEIFNALDVGAPLGVQKIDLSGSFAGTVSRDIDVGAAAADVVVEFCAYSAGGVARAMRVEVDEVGHDLTVPLPTGDDPWQTVHLSVRRSGTMTVRLVSLDDSFSGALIDGIVVGARAAGLRHAQFTNNFRVDVSDYLDESPPFAVDVVATAAIDSDVEVTHRFVGVIEVRDAGLHRFEVASDDGARLFVDGVLVVDNSGFHGVESDEGQLDLGVGDHRFDLRFYNGPGAGSVRVRWREPSGGDFVDIPADRLHTFAR